MEKTESKKKELRTEEPISEKDEVKEAEIRTAKLIDKVSGGKKKKKHHKAK